MDRLNYRPYIRIGECIDMNITEQHGHPEHLFSALAEETRLRILMLLDSEPQLCVCHLQTLLERPQSTISRHLAVLLEDQWLTITRQGTWNIYAINPELPLWVRQVIRLSRMSWSLSVEGRDLLKHADQIYRANIDRFNGEMPMPTTVDNASPKTTINVLFLCVANSARSIMAEALLNRWGGGRFKAYSAGQKTEDSEVHPLTLVALKQLGLVSEGLYSKHWSIFLAPDAPKMDMVITVCDTLLNEACPAWPGRPITAHWGVPDPARLALEHPEKDGMTYFITAARALEPRIRLLTQLPDYAIEKIQWRDEITAIGLINQ
jgi:protein-tyrosine-phosphatase/DNA-binding transcriptional ArsR family regulator